MMESQCKLDLTLDDHNERGCVARIVVDNQARHNILNSELIRQLTAAINSLADHERPRVLILTGAGDTPNDDNHGSLLFRLPNS